MFADGEAAPRRAPILVENDRANGNFVSLTKSPRNAQNGEG
jgi:hypothetical protein